MKNSPKTGGRPLPHGKRVRISLISLRFSLTVVAVIVTALASFTIMRGMRVDVGSDTTGSLPTTREFHESSANYHSLNSEKVRTSNDNDNRKTKRGKAKEKLNSGTGQVEALQEENRKEKANEQEPAVAEEKKNIEKKSQDITKAKPLDKIEKSNDKLTQKERRDSQDEQNNSVTKKRVDVHPRFAYAFLLGGIPTPGKEFNSTLRGNTPISPNAYKGLLYNILVSVKILQDSGSTADFVLLVHMAEPNVELSNDVVQLIEGLGIIVKYCPPFVDAIDEFSVIPMEKFRILDLIDYDRILYMDADVTPRCSLDYLMEQSYHGILQENVVISIQKTPASAKLFVLAPGPGRFLEFVSLIPPSSSTTGARPGFQPTGRAWGPSAKRWRSLTEEPGTRKSPKFNFEGADTDQGLLFHWTKYHRQNVSIIIGDEIENWSTPAELLSNEKIEQLGPKFETWEYTPKKHGYLINHPTKKKLNEFSCATDGDFRLDPRGDYLPSLEYGFSPNGVAPYRDFVQWEFAKSCPWHLKIAPLEETEKSSALYRDWFAVLKELDQRLKMGLGLQASDNTDLPDGANWDYIPKLPQRLLNPMWSEGTKALRQWANRLVDSSDIFLPWYPPRANEETSNGAQSSSFRDLRTNCQCPAQTTDMCSNPSESIESWLSRRVPYHLSMQRPLCPNAAQHDLHIVLTFDSSSSTEDMESSVCSAVCQEYSTKKVAIYVVNNGSPQPPKGHILESVNKRLDATWTASNEAAIRSHAKTTLSSMEHHEKAQSAPSVVSFHFSESIPKSALRFWSFALVENAVRPNDVIVSLENSEFSTPQALTGINEQYISHGALMTYGSYVDNSTDPSDNLPDSAFREKFQPRQNQPRWAFGGPYSFKASLLDKIDLSDFTNKDGKWRSDAYNINYIYGLLEMAGIRRLAFVSEPIARHHVGSTKPTRGGDEKNADGEEKQELQAPVQLIMVCAGNSDLLRKQFAWIQKQSAAMNETFSLHLLTDGSHDVEGAATAVDEFRLLQEKANFSAYIPISVSIDVLEPPLNSFSSVRFVRELRSRQPLDFVVLLDSDVYLGPDALAHLLKNREPKSSLSFSGKPVLEPEHNNQTGSIELQNVQPEFGQKPEGTHKAMEPVVYSGHSLAIFDANLWLFDKHLFRIQDDVSLSNHTEAADVWVSYVMDALLGWTQKRFLPDKPTVASLSRCSSPLYHQEWACSAFPKEVARSFKPNGRHVSATRAADDSKKLLLGRLQEMAHWDFGHRPRSAAELMTTGGGRRSLLHNEKLASDASDGPRRAFVCLTGQFERVELTSKIDSLMVPIQKRGFQVDVALAVSNGTAAFTNAGKSKTALVFKDRFKDAQKVPETALAIYDSFEHAVDELRRSQINIVSMDGPYPKLEKPYVPQHYVDLLKRSVVPQDRDKQDDRAGNHVRQFDSYKRCLRYAEQEATKAGSTLEDYYSVFIRIREDIAFYAGLDQSVLGVALPPPPRSMVVTECRSWNGMNDRLAFVSADIAREYFDRPLDTIMSGKIYGDGAVRNPESFLLYSYMMARHHVLGYRKLRGLVRIHKTKKGILENNDDLVFPGCRDPDLYRFRRFYDLYAWAV